MNVWWSKGWCAFNHGWSFQWVNRINFYRFWYLLMGSFTYDLVRYIEPRMLIIRRNDGFVINFQSNRASPRWIICSFFFRGRPRGVDSEILWHSERESDIIVRRTLKFHYYTMASKDIWLCNNSRIFGPNRFSRQKTLRLWCHENCASLSYWE